MWTVIYMAHNKEDAHKTKELLDREGFLIKIRSIGRAENRVYEILVPNGEVEEAHTVLADL